jgi:hypothetical protein
MGRLAPSNRTWVYWDCRQAWKGGRLMPTLWYTAWNAEFTYPGTQEEGCEGLEGTKGTVRQLCTQATT